MDTEISLLISFILGSHDNFPPPPGDRQDGINEAHSRPSQNHSSLNPLRQFSPMVTMY